MEISWNSESQELPSSLKEKFMADEFDIFSNQKNEIPDFHISYENPPM